MKLIPLFVFVSVIGFSVPLRAEETQKDTYEYQVITLRLTGTSDAKQTAVLNEHASQGWRLIDAFIDPANNRTLYLERKK